MGSMGFLGGVAGLRSEQQVDDKINEVADFNPASFWGNKEVITSEKGLQCWLELSWLH